MKLNRPSTNSRNTLSAIFTVFSLGVFAVCLTPSRADTYHAVEKGETLASIARQYNVPTTALRDANKLEKLGDNSALAAMLLRIPSGETFTAPPRQAAAPVKAAAASTPASGQGGYSGSLTKYISYTTRRGDTVEKVAANFVQTGHAVTAAEIRRKNKITNQPAAGSTLLIPVKTVYSLAAQVQPPAPQAAPAARAIVAASPADSGVIGVSVSGETHLPFARTIAAAGAPVYQAPNTPRPKSTTTRGNLSSRGRTPTANTKVDGARVLQNGEGLMTTPTPRVRTAKTPQPKLAKVAKVSLRGARIRRLPEAQAVTLYNCAVGTEMAITSQKGAWSAILMSDRSTGWLPTRYLKFTGSSVDISSQALTAERGDDSYTGWKGGYKSNHPAVAYALKWLGTPYRYGGQSTSGIDCSSLMQKAFAAGGVKLPRVSRDQAKVGRPIAPENLQPGDRLYFSSSGTHVDHTGVYMGGGLFVHASGSARKVTVSRLADRRTWNIFVGARR